MRSIADFENKVQRDLAWRKRELSDIRASARRSKETSRYIFRAGQVMLCAHWEGFLKRSTNLYVQHIFSQGLSARELNVKMLSISLYRDVMLAAEAKYPGSEGNHIRLAEKILSLFDQPLVTASWDVNTEGNPGSEVLKRILTSIGLHPNLEMDTAVWGATKVFIDEQLVADRHKIAHGEGFLIGKESLLERLERLLALLDTLASILLNAAESRAYLRDN